MTMTDSSLAIQRRLLKDEALVTIREMIAQGIWKEKLPSERYLTESLQLSRGTLRDALKNLRGEGIIESIPKQGHFIRERPKLKREQKKRPTALSIGLLSGEFNLSIKPSQLLTWLPELQSRIARKGWGIHTHEAIPELQRSPRKALIKLLEVTDHSCWLLTRCSKQVQQFFQSNAVPAIICGSPHPGIELPYIDVDHQSTARHAVGILAGRGHRNIGFVTVRQGLPGDLLLSHGFEQGIASSPHPLVRHTIRYSGSNYSFDTLVSNIATGRSPITALLVDRALQTIRIASRAQNRGIKIPEQLYLISREDAEFFNYFTPSLGRYRFNERTAAARIEQFLLSRIEGNPLTKKRQLIIPDFVE